MSQLNPNLNRPGLLREVQLSDVRHEGGVFVTSAHLIFNSRDGRRCAVFAAISVPDGPGPHPLVVHAPGGGQTVAQDDLAFWVEKGFACAAFDWQVGLFDHDPKRKSGWPAGVVLQSEPFSSTSQFIIPLAVLAVGVVIDWASSFPTVDRLRIGMTGISWGGYLTWVANAYEPRLKCAAPVYGCGGLFAEDRPGGPPRVSDEVAALWQANWEPLSLAPRQLSPVCWISGTNDFFGLPKDADAIMAQLLVPHRRSHGPNLNHSLFPEDTETVVAWMRHYLAGGPALPEEPQWMPGGLQVDRREEVESIEEWWTPSLGSSEDFCWWPGVARNDAQAKLCRIRYRNGIALTTPIQWLKPSPTASPLGDLWPDARAGVGYSNLDRGTQLHGATIRLESHPADACRSRLSVVDGTASPLIILRQFSDPRFICPGFCGLEVGVAPATSLPHQLNIVVRLGLSDKGGERIEFRGQVDVAGNGAVELSLRTLAFLPKDFRWNQVLSVGLDGFLSLPLEIGPLLRLRE